MDSLVIYYTGVGDYKINHQYTSKEFITLSNSNKEKFNYEYHNIPFPELNLNNYKYYEMIELIAWMGALVKFQYDCL